MIVYLLRHGIALDVGERGTKRDADRTLSRTGRERANEAARALALLKCRPERVLSSPLARAMETAELFSMIVAPEAKVETLDALKPGGKTAQIVNWLRVQPQKAVMLVGHMPDLGKLASVLVSNSKKCDIHLKKSGLCMISFGGKAKAGAGTLEWLIPPGMLRELARRI